MTDIVEYKISFGILGNLGLPLVKKQLEGILTYRRRKVEEMFS
jgi:hypothetical protein